MRLQSTIGAILCAAVCVTGLLTLGRGTDDAKADTHATLTSIHAAAPNFVGVKAWLNSGPLNIADLRGKVVLVAFWTYGCYNCVNTLPQVTRLYDNYRDKGFIVVGVHTPEFPPTTCGLLSNGTAFGIPWHKTTNTRPGTPTTINIGLRSTSSTKTERSCSNTPVRVNTRRLNGRFRDSSTAIVEPPRGTYDCGSCPGL